jgi:hypothetical protein
MYQGLAIALAGGALAGAAALRLMRFALQRMPLAVASGALVAGLAVVVLGVTWHPSAAPPDLRVERETAQAHPLAIQLRASVAGGIRTAAGEPVRGAAVALNRFERTELVEHLESRTSDDGRYVFTDLVLRPATAYRVSTEYEGTAFASDLLIPQPEHTALEADLVVAASTDDPASLSVPVDSTVVLGDERGLQVLQIMTVRNAGDRAYVGGLKLPLLPGATGLNPRKGADRTRLVLSGGGLVSSAPVLPGETEVVYDYVVPSASGRLAIDRATSYPTGRVELLVSPAMSVRSPDLEGGRPVSLDAPGANARRYRAWSATKLEPGAAVRATVRLPARSHAVRDSLVVAAVIGSLLAVAFPLLRRRSPSQDAPRVDTERAKAGA